MSRRGSSCSKRKLPPMPTAKELGELERMKQNEVSLKSKIRSVSLRKISMLGQKIDNLVFLVTCWSGTSVMLSSNVKGPVVYENTKI